MLTANERIRALVAAAWFGIMPWQIYESSCHFPEMTYWQHLKLNAETVLMLLLFKETEEDIAFERNTNHSWRINWIKGV